MNKESELIRQNNIKLLILDRDGVINRHSTDPDSPFYYILAQAHFIFQDRSIESFSLMKNLLFPICVCTRQNCISKGLITFVEVEDIMQKMNQTIERHGGRKVDKWFIEPTLGHKGVIFSNAINYFHVKPEETLVLDDNPKEIELALHMGMRVLRISEEFNLYDAITALIEKILVK